jgi:ABC-type antimicrobial peptide transport system permease subunit
MGKKKWRTGFQMMHLQLPQHAYHKQNMQSVIDHITQSPTIKIIVTSQPFGLVQKHMCHYFT